MAFNRYSGQFEQLIERIVNRHPHHSAFTLLFLVNAKLDDAPNEISQTPGQRCKNRSNSSKIPNNDLGVSKVSFCNNDVFKHLYAVQY
ncbi:unnamed protein product [Trichobilharzia regenti]|nr:unnamed protein product [Trichobilharzia regenti]